MRGTLLSVPLAVLAAVAVASPPAYADSPPRPNAPLVTSPDYDADGFPVDPRFAGIGHVATFNLDPNGSADVAGYVWSLGTDRGRFGTPVPAGQNVIRLTPDELGLNLLYVYVQDSTGSVGPVTQVEFMASDPSPQSGIFHLDGTAADSGPFGYAATGTFTPVAAGRVGGAARFDGSTDCLRTELPLVRDRGFALSVYARLAGTSRSGTALGVVNAAAGGASSVLADVGYDATARRWVFHLGDLAVRSTVPVPAGRWTLLTAVYDPGAQSMKLLVDGQLAGAAATGSLAFSANLGGTLSIGCGAQPWRGDLDEAQVWERILYPTEDSLLGDWELAGDATDSSGAGRDLRLPAGSTFGFGKANEPETALQLPAGTSATTAYPVLRTDRSYTIAAWVRTTIPTATQTALSQRGNHVAGISIGATGEFWTVTVPAADRTDATTVQLQSQSSISGSRWVLLVVVYDASAGELRFYLGNTASVPVLHATAPLNVGWNAAGPLVLGAGERNGKDADFWNGSIGPVRIWGEVLTRKEIENIR